MTVIKAADDKQPQIEALTALLGRADVDGAKREAIEREIATFRAGVKGERDAAYEIDFHYRDRESFAVIHDLRIEFAGRVAQIDHLILNQVFDLWVCETKTFKEGVKINEYGEWFRYGGGRAHGMASPVEQNRRHVAVLQDLIDKGPLRLPRRIVTLKPTLLPVVLVSNEARIDRPKSKKAAGRVDGLETVIKVEQLVRTIERRFDERNVVGIAAKLVGRATIEDIAGQLVALHRPATFDWASRFGPDQPGSRASAAPTGPTPPRLVVLPAAGLPVCASCGEAVSEKVASYSLEHGDRFGGVVLCWSCQRSSRPRRETGTPH